MEKQMPPEQALKSPDPNDAAAVGQQVPVTHPDDVGVKTKELIASLKDLSQNFEIKIQDNKIKEVVERLNDIEKQLKTLGKIKASETAKIFSYSFTLGRCVSKSPVTTLQLKQEHLDCYNAIKTLWNTLIKSQEIDIERFQVFSDIDNHFYIVGFLKSMIEGSIIDLENKNAHDVGVKTKELIASLKDLSLNFEIKIQDNKTTEAVKKLSDIEKQLKTLGKIKVSETAMIFSHSLSLACRVSKSPVTTLQLKQEYLDCYNAIQKLWNTLIESQEIDIERFKVFNYIDSQTYTVKCLQSIMKNSIIDLKNKDVQGAGQNPDHGPSTNLKEVVGNLVGNFAKLLK